MVALAVRYFGQTPVVCHARPLLHRAATCLEAGRLIEAGCLLREAVRLYLVAECAWHDCLPTEKQQRSTTCLIKSLKRAEPTFGFEWLEEVLGYGHTLAHCGHVRPSLIATSIEMVHIYLDAANYLREPKAAGRLS